MGATESRQKIGERVAAAKQELKDQSERAAKQSKLWKQSPSLLEKLLSNLEDLMSKRLVIPSNLIFYCWYADSKRVSKLLLNVCEKILNPESDHGKEYQWLNDNILTSLIWCLKCEDGVYMFTKLMNIADRYATNVAKDLSRTYSNLRKDTRFHELSRRIKDKTIINRQDNEHVGLLKNLTNDISKVNKNNKINNNNESKSDEKKSDDHESESSEQVVNIYVGLARLMTVGEEINEEYCNFMFKIFEPLLDEYRMVEFRRAPLKTFDRCQAKVCLFILFYLFYYLSTVLSNHFFSLCCVFFSVFSFVFFVG